MSFPGHYKVQSVLWPNLVMDLAHEALHDDIIGWDYHDGFNQKWELTNSGSGFKFTTQAKGGAKASNRNSNNPPIQGTSMHGEAPGNASVYNITRIFPGGHYIIYAGDVFGKSLNLTVGDKGAKITFQPPNGLNAGQHWELIRVD